MAARTVFGPYGSAEPDEVTRAEAPKATAALISVPTLPGILDAVHVHDEQAGARRARGGRAALAAQGRGLGARGRPEQRRRRAALRQRQHRDDVGGRLQRGDARRDAVGDGEDGRRVEAEALAELVRGLLPQEDGLRPPAGRQRSRDHVGAFRQEGAFAVAELTLAQRRRSFDERVLRAGQWCAENPKRLASLASAGQAASRAARA